jgi:hypothetical protein
MKNTRISNVEQTFAFISERNLASVLRYSIIYNHMVFCSLRNAEMRQRHAVYFAITIIVLFTFVFSWLLYPRSEPPPDGNPPTVSLSSPENKTYNVNAVSLTSVVSSPTSWVGYSLDGRANVTIIANTTLTELSEGSHTIVVYANDSSGNSWSSETVYFTIDTLPPSISILSPENKTYATADVLLSVAVNEATSRMEYSLDGNANVTILGNTTLTGLSDGSHVLTVYATDAAGNTGTSRASFNIAQTTNIVQSQGFEEGFGDWVSDADVPLDPNNPGQPVEWHVSLVSNISHSGQNSLRLFIDGSQDDGTVWVEKEVDVPRNSLIRVVLSFWFYSTEQSDNEIAVVCAYANLANPEVEADFTFLGSANEVAGWRDYSLMTSLYSGSSGKLWVAVGISVSWETRMTYYVDDIEIKTGPE